MFKLITIAFLLTPLSLISQVRNNNNFTINGKVGDYSGSVNNFVYLTYIQNDITVKDSSRLINGSYSFVGNLKYPVQAVLQLKMADSTEKYYLQTRLLKPYAHDFYLDKGSITAISSGEMRRTIIEGSPAEDDLRLLNSLIEPLNKRSDSLYSTVGKRVFAEKDSAGISKYLSNIYKLDDLKTEAKLHFMQQNPGSGIVLDLLKEYTRSNLDPNIISPIFEKVKQELRNSTEGKRFANRIREAFLTASGMPAPNFTLKDRDGHQVKLGDLKGKVVLLDFWGSWCSPCRSTHPHLRELYATYKNKGFEILGVSNEHGEQEDWYKKWTTALDEDQMSWLNVLNDKEPIENDKDVVALYSVKAFPTKVLIGRDGVIIKRFVGSSASKAAELDALLKKLL